MGARGGAGPLFWGGTGVPEELRSVRAVGEAVWSRCSFRTALASAEAARRGWSQDAPVPMYPVGSPVLVNVVSGGFQWKGQHTLTLPPGLLVCCSDLSGGWETALPSPHPLPSSPRSEVPDVHLGTLSAW